jgi:hypothetical protein
MKFQIKVIILFYFLIVIAECTYRQEAYRIFDKFNLVNLVRGE